MLCIGCAVLVMQFDQVLQLCRHPIIYINLYFHGMTSIAIEPPDRGKFHLTWAGGHRGYRGV